MEPATVITAAAIILLVLHWKGPNAVWGGATLGVIAGIIAAIITKDWGQLSSFFAIGTIIGAFSEWIGRIASRFCHKRG